MLTGSTKFLHGLCLLASRNTYLEFHTTACALKGDSRKRKRASKVGADAHPALSSSRKRLVPTLKPAGESGTYEVAPRPRKSSDKRSRRWDEQAQSSPARTGMKSPQTSKASDETSRRWDEQAQSSPARTGMKSPQTSKASGETSRRWDEQAQSSPARTGMKSPQTSKEGSPSRSEVAFTREDAPHVGRASWQRPRSSVSFRREATHDYANGFSRQRSSFGLRRNDSLSSRGDGIRSRDAPFRGEEAPDASRARQSFSKRMSSEREPSRTPKVYDSNQQYRSQPSKVPIEEFHTPQIEPLKTLPTRFTSPPLFSGLLQSVHEVLGSDARPSPIQSLSLKHLFTPPPHIFPTGTQEGKSEQSSLAPAWGQYLLASETGSGKSIAYLLPMIQYLKLTESSPPPLPSLTFPPSRSLALNPRGLILAPTHELSRQLSTFAKSLLHNVRLRVLCASRANTSSSSHGTNSTASQMKRELNDTDFGLTDEAHIIRRNRPLDVLVGTPTKVLEMARGWGWNREDKIEDHWDDAQKDRARKWVPGPSEVGLSKIEWVVIDEADILFDNDFEQSTRLLLADIAQARGYTHPSFSTLRTQSPSTTPPSPDLSSQPLTYPFHLLLTSATIPSSLASYLTTHHPKLTRLASPNLHRLPSTLKTEYHAWTSGNKNSDIERRIRHVWADDARSNMKSKILVFCNKSSKVEDLGLYLKEKGIPNVALTSTAAARFRGSNRHLAGFLKDTEAVSTVDSRVTASPSEPHVMITTSLLSRGLDFSPQIKYVFIADEPRNMIDFLHRAGRSGRAGNEGKVVVFGKVKGRGSDNAREVRRKIGALAH